MTGPRHSREQDPPIPTQSSGETVLLIGRTTPGTADHFRQSDVSIVLGTFALLDAAFLLRVAPHTIAFPLMAKDCDAAQVLAQLHALGFTGRALIFAPRLPNRDMVLRELKPLAPGLARITLLELPES
jgi:hypothetical protein